MLFGGFSALDGRQGCIHRTRVAQRCAIRLRPRNIPRSVESSGEKYDRPPAHVRQIGPDVCLQTRR